MTAATGSSSTGYRYAGTTQDELVHQDLTSGASIDYVYGRTTRLGQPIIQSLTKSDQAGTVYLDHDPAGTPQVLTTAAGVENFYVFDGTVGNPVGLVNTSGTVVAGYAYDPYGTYTTTSSTGSAAGINPYRSAGGLYDHDTGWIKYGQRWYNPATGRFTQQDTIERYNNPQQGNRYTYAADNPTNYTDPTGKDFGCVIAGFAAVGAFLGLAGGIFTVPETFGGGLVVAGLMVTSLGTDLAVLGECIL